MSCYPSAFDICLMGDVQFVHGDISQRWLDGRGLLCVGSFVGFHREGVAER